MNNIYEQELVSCNPKLNKSCHANCESVLSNSLQSVETLRKFLCKLFSYGSIVNERDTYITTLIDYWVNANKIEIPLSELLGHKELLNVREDIIIEAISKVETLVFDKERFSVKLELRPPRSTITLRDIEPSVTFTNIVELLRECPYLNFHSEIRMKFINLVSAKRYYAWQGTCFWFLTFKTEPLTLDVAMWLQSQTLNNSLLKVRMKTETYLTAAELLYHRKQRRTESSLKNHQSNSKTKTQQQKINSAQKPSRKKKNKQKQSFVNNNQNNNNNLTPKHRSQSCQIPKPKEFPSLYDTIDSNVSRQTNEIATKITFRKKTTPNKKVEQKLNEECLNQQKQNFQLNKEFEEKLTDTKTNSCFLAPAFDILEIFEDAYDNTEKYSLRCNEPLQISTDSRSTATSVDTDYKQNP